MTVHAVILAGGDGTAIDGSVPVKGLVPVGGKQMVEWVVDAMIAAESIDGIAVVIPTTDALGPWADKVSVVVSDKAFIDNTLAGIDSFSDDNPVLVSTGDLPALTGEAVDDFVAQTMQRGADISYPLIPQSLMEEQFPGSKRTYIKLVDGTVTGGNMMFLSQGVVQRNREIGQQLFETRKSPIQMARIIGLPFIIKLVTGRLDPTDVEKKMAALLGGECAAIRTTYASIGADVDKSFDVNVAERVLLGYAQA